MIKKIKSYALTLIAMLTFAAPAVVPLTVSAATDICGNNTIGGQVSTGANHAASGQSTNDCNQQTGVNQDSLGNIGHKIVNIFSLIIGIIAVIMIIVGGFRYITSGGSSEKIGSAKNTLIYAIIGLVIVALAQIIVHFVLNTTSGAINNQNS